jgi:hypothetical protein
MAAIAATIPGCFLVPNLHGYADGAGIQADQVDTAAPDARVAEPASQAGDAGVPAADAGVTTADARVADPVLQVGSGPDSATGTPADTEPFSCTGAVFCTPFPGPSLGEWDSSGGYGGGEWPVLDSAEALTPPYSMRLHVPTTPTGAGTTALKGASPSTVGYTLSFAVRLNALPPTDITIGKLDIGSGTQSGVLIVNVSTSALTAEFSVGATIYTSPALPSLKAGQWSVITATVALGVPNSVTVTVDAEPPSSFTAGSATFGASVALEMGLVYVPPDTPDVVLWMDDVALRGL